MFRRLASQICGLILTSYLRCRPSTGLNKWDADASIPAKEENGLLENTIIYKAPSIALGATRLRENLWNDIAEGFVDFVINKVAQATIEKTMRDPLIRFGSQGWSRSMGENPPIQMKCLQSGCAWEGTQERFHVLGIRPRHHSKSSGDASIRMIDIILAHDVVSLELWKGRLKGRTGEERCCMMSTRRRTTRAVM